MAIGEILANLHCTIFRIPKMSSSSVGEPIRTIKTLEEKHEEFAETTGMSIERGMSKPLMQAVERGADKVSKKCAWPFDFYQATDLYPVDYHYWWTPYKSCVGQTQLVMMHAIAVAEDGSEVAADQMVNRERMRHAHLGTLKNFLQQTHGGRDYYGPNGSEQDPFGGLQHLMTWTEYARNRSL
ncbi:MAG: uncharacterized protein KVP18_003491 [Porospora cf. gigantea A]|uniref:uncharacterized protein n=1 Tax=Porospora cf. gigantea A TaxID=2853593 RepID=UPI003559A18A|nr:MAG: hypothetical protein KVP18_003491 [Porospora cf. gigantea A]